MLDKTGTITAGRPALTDVSTAGRWDDDELLALVAAAESDSEHPLGAAIVAGARERGVGIPAATAFESVTGQGVQATVAGHPVLVGSARLLAAAGISAGALRQPPRSCPPRAGPRCWPPSTASRPGCWRSPTR